MELKKGKKIKIKKQTVMRRIKDLKTEKLKRKEITPTKTRKKLKQKKSRNAVRVSVKSPTAGT